MSEHKDWRFCKRHGYVRCDCPEDMGLSLAEFKRLSDGITVQSGSVSFTIKRGIMPGNIWLEREDGEGGDFDAAALYNHLGKFYDEHF